MTSDAGQHCGTIKPPKGHQLSLPQALQVLNQPTEQNFRTVPNSHGDH